MPFPSDVSPGLLGLVLAIATVLAVLGLRSAVLVAGAFVWLRHSAFARGRRVTPLRYRPGQLGSELRAAVVTLAFDATVIVVVARLGWLQLVPPDAQSIATTFMALFVFTEVWFYLCHRAMHSRSLFWIHRQHHTALVVDPLTSLSFSLAERALLLGGIVLFVILWSRVLPVTAAGIALYGFTNYALNVLGHSNVEIFPGWFARSTVGRWLVTPTYHSLHHLRYRGHYGLFTTVLDRLGKSVFDDYDQIQHYAATGRMVPPES